MKEFFSDMDLKNAVQNYCEVKEERGEEVILSNGTDKGTGVEEKYTNCQTYCSQTVPSKKSQM